MCTPDDNVDFPQKRFVGFGHDDGHGSSDQGSMFLSQFSAIFFRFSAKYGVFLKNQKISSILNKNAMFFTIFLANIFFKL
jgi:hypothetical protein